MNQPTRVLIIDDSALVRRLMSDLLKGDPEIEVVGTAPDPLIARQKIKQLSPDVLTLDVEMPKMDGITFLSHLMRLRPMPVVMISSLTARGASVTLDALELGAVDFLTKPSIDLAHSLKDYKQEIREKIKVAPTLFRHSRHRTRPHNKPKLATQRNSQAGSLGFSATEKIVAIGASTGGTEALKDVIVDLPSDFPGIVVVQHIPAMFSRQFAERVNLLAEMVVKEALDGERILAGHVYVSPGDRHLEVVRDGASYRCRLIDTEPVNRHKPSVDVLFDSVAKALGSNATGVILTGMGKDGARGLLSMKNAGAKTIAQDEASSVVWGMPGAAVETGAVDSVLPLELIAPKLRSVLSAARPRLDGCAMKGQEATGEVGR